MTDNANDGDNNQMKDRLLQASQAPKNRIDKFEVFRAKFWSILQNGSSSALAGGYTDVLSSWKDAKGDDYSHERPILESFMRPLAWGIASSLFLFTTFRITGNNRYQQWIRRQRGFPVQTAGANNNKDASSSLPTDMLISTMVGISAIILNINPQQFARDFAQAPLVPGKSRIAQFYCPDMIQLSRQVDWTSLQKHTMLKQQEIENYDGKRGKPCSDLLTLQTFSEFVENCHIRHRVESALAGRDKQEDPSSSLMPLSIPASAFDEFRQQQEQSNDKNTSSGT